MQVPSFTAAKILWLKRNEPELYAHMEHVLLPHDYMNYYLTGRMVMEASSSTTPSIVKHLQYQHFAVQRSCCLALPTGYCNLTMQPTTWKGHVQLLTTMQTHVCMHAW